jgi:carboxyl-terminal processing protease
MMIASNRNGGGTVNSPDQCLSQWVNFGNMAEASSFSPNILASGGNLIFMASELAISHGDEVDTGAYVPTIGPAFFPMGIPNILVNGNPGIALMCPVISNAGNTTQGSVVNPSPVNVFMMYAAAGQGGSPSPAMAPEALGQLEAALADPSGPGRGDLVSGEIGYVAIHVLSSSVPSMVHAAIRGLEARGMKTLILDLRDNGGGEVIAALELAGDFLEPGTLLATLRDGDGDETEYRARAGEPHRVPVLLLVNQRTASAAELFVGCLQANRRAVVAGQRTRGKGIVQTIVRREEDGAPERRSVALCLLPNGEAIHGIGIYPDVELGSPRR